MVMGSGEGQRTRKASNASVTSLQDIKIFRRATEANSFKICKLSNSSRCEELLSLRAPWLVVRHSIDQHIRIEESLTGHWPLLDQKQIRAVKRVGVCVDERAREVCFDRGSIRSHGHEQFESRSGRLL